MTDCSPLSAQLREMKMNDGSEPRLCFMVSQGWRTIIQEAQGGGTLDFFVNLFDKILKEGLSMDL